VLSVDYRLAPEHRFPAAVEDALEAWRWTVKAAASFGGDPSRIAIGGDSAGGNLAAVTSLLVRDSEVDNPILQMLIYPVTDLSRESASYAKFASGFYLSRDTMRWFRAHYLSDGQLAADQRASPLLAPSLAGLPATYLATAGFDVLRDEGQAYAERLRADGVSVECRNYPDLIHGYFNMSGIVDSAGQAFADAVVALRRAFGHA
jgi:acetyl esterase